MVTDILIAIVIVIIAAVLGLVVHPVLWVIVIAAVLWIFGRRGAGDLETTAQGDSGVSDAERRRDQGGAGSLYEHSAAGKAAAEEDVIIPGSGVPEDDEPKDQPD